MTERVRSKYKTLSLAAYVPVPVGISRLFGCCETCVKFSKRSTCFLTRPDCDTREFERDVFPEVAVSSAACSLAPGALCSVFVTGFMVGGGRGTAGDFGEVGEVGD